MTIFLPGGETNERDRLLSLLMEWTTEPRLLAAMVKRGLADFPGLAVLGATVRATLDESERLKLVTPDGRAMDPQQHEAQPLTERQMAAAVLAFIQDSQVRNVVAKYVVQAHGDKIEGEDKLDSVKRDLRELRQHIKVTYRVKGSEIPQLRAGNPEAQAEVMAAIEAERALRNEAMAWPVGGEKPEWVTAYEADDQDVADELAAWLRDRPEGIQSLAKRFPPHCLVRAKVPMLCPGPGLVGIVKGYDIEDGVAFLGVSAWLDDEAATAGAMPEDLEVVAHRGRVTPDAVASALEVPRVG